ALSGHADAVLAAMSAEDKKLTRAALLWLVTPERTRNRIAMRELYELGPRAADMERVLGRAAARDRHLRPLRSRRGTCGASPSSLGSLASAWRTTTRRPRMGTTPRRPCATPCLGGTWGGV